MMRKGFTIIETTLVLSISALLAVMLMVGWNQNINNQRYEDTVQTLRSDIQQVFTDVQNPSTIAKKGICWIPTTGTPNVSVKNDDKGIFGNFFGTGAGTSDCIIMGKLVIFSNHSPKAGERKDIADPKDNRFRINNHDRMLKPGITVYSVVGRDVDISKGCSGSCVNHIDAIKAANITLVEDSRVFSELQWNSYYKTMSWRTGASSFERTGSILKRPKFTLPVKDAPVSSFVILRSPIDGSIMSFKISETLSNTSAGLVNTFEKEKTAFLNESRIVKNDKPIEICVMKDGGSSAGNKVIKIGPNISSVEIAKLDEMNCEDNGNLVVNGIKVY